MSQVTLSYSELLEAWPVLSDEDRLEAFNLLSRIDAEELFLSLNANDQAELLMKLAPGETRLWLRVLAPDDAADVIQAVTDESRELLMALLDDVTRREVIALLAYAEDEAGGLMNPRFARLRPDISADEAISYLRRQTRERVENIYYAYVLDSQQHLLGVVSLRELVTSPPNRQVRDFMHTDVVSVSEETDQEAVSKLFAEHDLVMIPVLDEAGAMKGVVSVDDIVDVVREEATEDMQKIGGLAALESTYLKTGMLEMVKKRAPWLIVLFIGQTFTFNVMEHFEQQLAVASVLIIFIPLILSSGGNAGSQAATLIVRSLALDELRLREWWRVFLREIAVGVALGAILAGLGFGRILLWRWLGWGEVYTADYLLVGATVAASVLAVVLWGTLAGSMLPMLLRRMGLDPASASTPFVATLCDVTGLVIYFSVAILLLRGTLL